MITIRASRDRGHAQHGWLESRHTFSFADYHDPSQMGFRALRVINEDRVEPGKGFPSHSHRDMEILSYVLDGAVEHRDSMGNGSVIRPGDVQLMSAGTGVTHSEYNHSATEPVHFLQIWILPDRAGHAPSYAQQHFAAEEKRNTLKLVASAEGPLRVHQDVSVHACRLDEGRKVMHDLASGRSAWIQVARGKVTLRGSSASETAKTLVEGDGAAIEGESRLELEAESPCELLLFDLA